MDLNPRIMPLLAATTSIAATLAIASPALAADMNPPGRQAAGVASVKTASTFGGHHQVLPRRIAASHAPRVRYADASSSGLQCATSWCARPVVLMIGIAY